MRRQRWFEIHDQPWFPAPLRDRVTEALEAVWNGNRTYHPIASRLREAVRHSGARQIVDLCSGGGGPWLGLYPEVADGQPLTVWLTDLYPNAILAGDLAADLAIHSPLRARAQPVDARAVPADLPGFRTLFSSFHHFGPDSARAMLADAFTHRQGIGIFEAARCTPWTLLAVNAVPLLGLREAARARPVRFRRLFWTFLVPVVPATLWLDGLLSCLRSYSLADMAELTHGLTADDYAWQIGEAHGGRVPIRYLIGQPRTPCLRAESLAWNGE
ncbi:MAG: class I SAM-dependent methyltransferase [Acidobacteriaceae bacterium]